MRNKQGDRFRRTQQIGRHHLNTEYYRQAISPGEHHKGGYVTEKSAFRFPESTVLPVTRDGWGRNGQVTMEDRRSSQASEEPWIWLSAATLLWPCSWSIVVATEDRLLQSAEHRALGSRCAQRRLASEAGTLSESGWAAIDKAAYKQQTFLSLILESGNPKSRCQCGQALRRASNGLGLGCSPKSQVFRGGDFGRRLDHGGGILITGLIHQSSQLNCH